MIKEIIKEIEQAPIIILHRHVQPDGDAIGSSVGLKKWIQLNYPEKEVYVVGQNHVGLQRYGLMDQIDDSIYEHALVIVTDCGNVERIDDQRFNLGAKLIKIDHHPNVTPYGDMQWVDTSFTAASEMIGLLVKEANLKINPDIAETIFLGIVTDSQRFQIAKTTPRTFEIAAFLTKTGFDLNQFYLNLYTKNIETLQLRSELLQNMKLDKHVGSIYLTKELMDKYHIPFRDNGMYSNVLQGIDGIDIWVTFAANENNGWRVEFRSKAAPVNKVAVKWGGGGHDHASGAVITDLADAAKIVSDLQQLLREYE